jgi:hypothetical protein
VLEPPPVLDPPPLLGPAALCAPAISIEPAVVTKTLAAIRVAARKRKVIVILLVGRAHGERVSADRAF